MMASEPSLVAVKQPLLNTALLGVRNQLVHSHLAATTAQSGDHRAFQTAATGIPRSLGDYAPLHQLASLSSTSRLPPLGRHTNDDAAATVDAASASVHSTGTVRDVSSGSTSVLENTSDGSVRAVHVDRSKAYHESLLNTLRRMSLPTPQHQQQSGATVASPSHQVVAAAAGGGNGISRASPPVMLSTVQSSSSPAVRVLARRDSDRGLVSTAGIVGIGGETTRDVRRSSLEHFGSMNRLPLHRKTSTQSLILEHWRSDTNKMGVGDRVLVDDEDNERRSRRTATCETPTGILIMRSPAGGSSKQTSTKSSPRVSFVDTVTVCPVNDERQANPKPMPNDGGSTSSIPPKSKFRKPNLLVGIPPEASTPRDSVSTDIIVPKFKYAVVFTACL